MLVRSFGIASMMTLFLSLFSAPMPLSAQRMPQQAQSSIQIPGPETSEWLGWSTAGELPEAAPLQERRWGGRPLAMMAAGGAALVLGLVIGGDGGFVVASVGGLVALIGMYRYVR